MTNTVGQTQTDHFPQEPQRFLNNMVFESVIFSKSLAMHDWVSNIYTGGPRLVRFLEF